MPDETKGPEGPHGEGMPSDREPQKLEDPGVAPVYSSRSDPYGIGEGVSAPLESPAVPVAPVSPAAQPAIPPGGGQLQALAKRAGPLSPPSPPPTKPPPPKPPPEDADEEADPEESGMLRMSFMEHLEELRIRILRALIGVVVAFVASIVFCKELWQVVSAPAVQALTNLGVNPPNLAQIKPMEQFSVIYVKLPLLVSVFLGSPWILYQVWAFISPGLYKKEKRWAVPFIVSTAGLFITGGLFAYFVAFRFGLEFLLGIGRDVHVTPVVSIDEYFDLFVNVTLGVGLVFEMPVIIFFLTLLRLASPRFLIAHSRYAILAIVIIAAIVTPTPDIFNMMLFAVPMVALFFVGVFASWLLVLKREGKRFPWGILALVFLGLLLIGAGAVAVLIFRYHFHFIQKWPFLVQ